MRTLLRSQVFLAVLWGAVMATLPYTTYKILLFQRQAPSLFSAHLPALLFANIAIIVLLVGTLLLVTSAHWQLRQPSASRVSSERPEPARQAPSRSTPPPRSRAEAPVEGAAATGLQLVEIGTESPLQSRLPIGAVVESVNGTPATSLAAAESVLKPGVNEIDWRDDTGKRNMAYVMVRDGKLHAEFRSV
ncbi:hypothetical protein KZO85_14610 [Chromohalobacter canadensis]|uniref:hypothetical protein n=1 Tax=Chromohalobacter canadensis TaxID=141389 RepID=UPI0021BFBA54|nr:hypothetical protein [Chromohalobacter canadensis]MCT8469818.1 hypothetical protein [Chromohalobacter canadensis]MCT8472348.1 hypothetical protein [Chromohalobacter canadensis]MCT8499540.1 hypothetical protein [Chromohalobacter canadensis]